MSTKIFEVKYTITEKNNGKETDSFKEMKTVTAKNAMDAIAKVEAYNKKPFNYTDDETKKKHVITRTNFELRSVNLIAESDL